jgi:Domain of unknown function (DUF4175)
MPFARHCIYALLLTFAASLSLRADEPDPSNQQELLLQQERQKQIQAETDYVVRRMGTMLRVLDFYQLDKTSEKKMLEDLSGVLGGLSKTQMTEVIRRLEAAAQAKNADQSNKEVEAAYARHREILESLKAMLSRYDAIRSLDQAADRLDKQAQQQLDLHFLTAQIARDIEDLQKPGLSQTQRLLIVRRYQGRGLNFKRQGDDQSDLQVDVFNVLKQVKELESKLTDEQQQRVALVERLVNEFRLQDNMTGAAQRLRSVAPASLGQATELQWKSATQIKELARVLRLPGDLLAILKEARDRVDQAIVKQADLSEDTRKEIIGGPKKDEAKKDPPNRGAKDDPRRLTFPDTNPLLEPRVARTALYPREELEKAVKNAQAAEKSNDLSKQQAKLEYETKDTANLVKPVAKDAAEKLEAAEKAMQKAKDALAKAEPRQAPIPQEKATQDLKQARQEIDKLIDKLDKQKNDPIAALKNAAEKLDKIIKEQTDTRDKTKQTADAKQNQKTPQLAEKQKELAKETNQLKEQPLPAKDKVEPALAKAEKAMQDAAKALDKKQSPDALPKQDQALKNLEEARKEIGEKIAEMEKRKDDLAKLEDAAKKLDDLAKQEGKVADKATDLAKKPEPAASKDLAKNQDQLTPQAKDLAKDLQKTAPEAADKVAESTKNMQAAKKELDNNKPMPGAKEAKEATDKLNEAQKALAKAMEDLKAKDIADQLALQPKTADPAAAAQQLAKALEQTEKAQQEAKAAEMSQPNADLAKQQAEIANKAEQMKLEKAGDPAAKAAEALKQGDLDKALGQQEKALAKLQEAAGKPPMPGEAKPAAMAKQGDMPAEAKDKQAGEPNADAQAKTGDAKAGEKMSGEAKEAMAKAGDKNQDQKPGGAMAQAKGQGEPKAGQAPSEAKTPGQLAQAQKEVMDATEALAKSQQATQAAQAALAQAQAQAPKAVQPQLQEASKQLAQANQQLQKAAPMQAGEAQKQAAQQLGQALDTLNAALAAQNQPPVQPGQPATAQANPMTAQNQGKDGPPMPGDMGDDMGMGQGEKEGKGQAKNDGQGKPMPGQQAKGQEKNENKGTGDRTPDGKLANAKSQANSMDGDGSFLHLPPRQRELIRQALSGSLPPEYAALIQQYYINIARGRSLPSAPAPTAPNR